MAECPEAFFAVPGRDPNASERSIVPSLGAWWTCRAVQPPRATAPRDARGSAPEALLGDRVGDLG
ncbi:MAG TPA: hypothetical protein PKC95_06420, partial [Thauera aminoaromatica]|nr:hypothetical protein [Thauera aminoaromatica]